MRPPGRRRVEVAVGERKGVAAVARHQPQLVPLAAEVGAVDDAFAVGGPVGARLPGRLLVAQLARRGHASRARRHAPEPARAVDVPAIRDADDLAAVRRPRGRQVVVPAAVVVARQAAVVVVGDPLHRAGLGPARREREDVPAPVVARGDERDAGAVRGPARLEVHGPIRRERPRRTAREIEQLQLDGVLDVGRVDDESPVGRPIGLVVVPGPRGELLRHARSQPLPPQRPLHGVDQLAPVRRPGGGAGPARDLGDVHLTPVVGVGHVHLLQDRLALRRGGDGRRDEQRYRAAAIHRSIFSRSMGRGTAPSSSTRSWNVRMSNLPPSALSAAARSRRISSRPRAYASPCAGHTG